MTSSTSLPQPPHSPCTWTAGFVGCEHPLVSSWGYNGTLRVRCDGLMIPSDQQPT